MTLREFYQNYHIESDKILVVVTHRDELLTINIADGEYGAGGKSICLFTEPVDREVESFLDSVVERIRNIRGIPNSKEIALNVFAELFYGYCSYLELKTQASRADMWNYEGLKEFWDSKEDLISQIRKIDYESNPRRFVFEAFEKKEALIDKFNRKVAKQGIRVEDKFTLWFKADDEPIRFNEKQAIALEFLAETYLNKRGRVHMSKVLSRELPPKPDQPETKNYLVCSPRKARMNDLFKRVPRWKEIVRMPKRGYYELNID